VGHGACSDYAAKYDLFLEKGKANMADTAKEKDKTIHR
jgi:hypothetical protein